MTTYSPVAQNMKAARDAGISVIPVLAQTKRPATNLLPPSADSEASWKQFQTEIANDQWLGRWNNVEAFAVVGGKVSGGLCVIDFESSEFYQRWRDAVGDLANGLPVQRTGGGGAHVYFRCPNPGRNQKLAFVPDETQKDGRAVIIETRAEGGYAVGDGSLHPSGNRYEMLSGSYADIPTISQAKADALLDQARKLDEAPFTRKQIEQAEAAAIKTEKHRQQMNGQASVIDEWNARHSLRDILLGHGYKQMGRRMLRPNAEPTSEPGLVFLERNGREVCYAHSTNDALSNSHAHDALRVDDHE